MATIIDPPFKVGDAVVSAMGFVSDVIATGTVTFRGRRVPQVMVRTRFGRQVIPYKANAITLLEPYVGD